MEAGTQDCLRARSKSQTVGSDQFPTEDSWDKQIHRMTPPLFAENVSIRSLKAMLMGAVSASVALRGGTFLKTVP